MAEMEERKLRRKKEKAYDEGTDEHVAEACNKLGDFYNQHGRHEEACTEYEHESKIYAKLGKRLEMAKANRMMGEMFMLLSEFDKALKHVNIYLKIVKQLSNKVEMQRAYTTLGRAYLLQGQSATDTISATRPLRKAEKAFIQSLLICKELTGSVSKLELLDMQARIYLNVGVVHEHLEDFEQSMSYMEKAIKICKVNDLFELLHHCYVSASLLYHYKKLDTSLALRFCNLALEISERLSNRPKKECETLSIKAEIMIQLGDFQSAKQILHKAYKLKSPEINDRQNVEKMLRVVAAICIALDNLVTVDSHDNIQRKSLYEKIADGCCILQNYKKAIDYYQKMLECAEEYCESQKDLVPVYVSLYQTYKDDKQYEKASEYLWKEYEINKDEPVEAFNTLCNIAEIYEMESKPFWTIHDCYQKAIDEAQKSNNSRLERIATVRLMKLQQKFSMFTSMETLKDEASKRGIDLDKLEDDSDNESGPSTELNTPDVGDDICLEDLTDSNDEEDTKPEAARARRKRNTGITVKRNAKGETQLHQACIAGNLELARRLIEQGHIVNVRDHAGWLPLHEACNHGYRDIVEILLDNGAAATINDKGGTGCDGITPLYDACSNGYLDVAELLLVRGANATLKTDFGETVLAVLDRWRNTIDLNAFEQSQFEHVRSKIADQLTKAGMLSDLDVLRSSLPDKNGVGGQADCNSENEISLERLRKLAYSETSSSDDENVYRSRSSIDQSRPRNEEDNSGESRSSKILYENKNPRNAKEEYKNVMQSLKHPNRMVVSDNDIATNKRSGYLKDDEIDDDWLIDDLRPDKKKRKLLTDRNLYESISGLNSRQSSAPNLKENFHISQLEADDSQDAFKILGESRGVAKTSKKTRMSRKASLTDTKSKKQASLLDSGFCRFRSESPLSIDGNSENEPDSTTCVFSVIRSPQKDIEPTLSALFSFKIKVEEEMLLIPIERKKLAETNMRWLAEEASRRYYNLVGLRPVLRLMTADGFAFEENDFVNVATEQNTIAAKILEWKISPLSQRYEEMCIQMKLGIDKYVKSALEKSLSNCVILNDYVLTPDRTVPIFKALLHQTALRVLDLSNNFIQDEGCRQLGRSLETLKQLKTLNLQGNCITAEGMNCLSEATITELEELVLSNNPLGDVSFRALETICQRSAKLRKLHLSSCMLRNFNESNLRFSDLIDFDISFNDIVAYSFKSLVSKLNSCRLQFLNFNYYTKTNDQRFGEIFLDFLQSGTCEKFRSIDLSGCQLTDLDVFNIALHLVNANDLERLNLSANEKLTPTALQHVLERLPHVKIIHMQECWCGVKDVCWTNLNLGANDKTPELIEVSTNDRTEEQQLRDFWEARHGSLAKVSIRGSLLRMYLSGCD